MSHEAREVRPNEAAVAGQTVQKLRPCDRCGKFRDVTITYAVPLDEGGLDLEWNWNSLCAKCRRERVDLQERQMRGASPDFPDGPEWPDDSSVYAPSPLRTGDRVDCAMCGAEFAVPPRNQRTRVWSGRGGLVCRPCALWGLGVAKESGE